MGGSTVQLVRQTQEAAVKRRTACLNAVAVAVSFEAEYAGKLFDRKIVIRLRDGTIVEASDPERLLAERELHEDLDLVVVATPLCLVKPSAPNRHEFRQSIAGEPLASLAGQVVEKRGIFWAVDAGAGSVLIPADSLQAQPIQLGDWVSVESAFLAVLAVQQ